jgi:hypoxanthine phosphoribosyltransferase
LSTGSEPPARRAGVPLAALPQQTPREPLPAPPAPLPAGYPPGGEVLFTAARIGAAVGRMAERIDADYRGQDLVAVVILHGGVVFAADLIRRLQRVNLRLETLLARSYVGTASQTGGQPVPVLAHGPLDVAGRAVLLVDDILDTGRTLAAVRADLLARGAASIAIAVLLDKPSRRQIDVRADYRGLVVPDVFVVGYGLDFDGRWRNLPDIVALPHGGAHGAGTPAVAAAAHAAAPGQPGTAVADSEALAAEG